MKHINDYLATLNRAPKYTHPIKPQRGTRSVAQIIIMALVLLAGYIWAPDAWASDCNFNYTPEQWRVLNIAYRAGEPYGYGNTLVALIEREAFVGTLIVRISVPRRDVDKWEYSVGIGHMRLTTAMQVYGYDNIWQASAELVPALMQNDYLAAQGVREYLLGHIHRHGWRRGIARYNGGSMSYANAVADRALHFEKCGVFGSWAT